MRNLIDFVKVNAIRSLQGQIGLHIIPLDSPWHSSRRVIRETRRAQRSHWQKSIWKSEIGVWFLNSRVSESESASEIIPGCAKAALGIIIQIWYILSWLSRLEIYRRAFTLY